MLKVALEHKTVNLTSPFTGNWQTVSQNRNTAIAGWATFTVIAGKSLFNRDSRYCKKDDNAKAYGGVFKLHYIKRRKIKI